MCGDGCLSQGEECDDGGTGNGDKCSAVCQKESVSQISAAAFMTCAVLHDGRAKCWGSNTSGELGQGDTVTRGVSPGQMGANLPAIDFGAGKRSMVVAAGSCAVLNNGSFKCWGYNGSGTLGYGNTVARGDGPQEMGDSLPTIDLGTGEPVKAIATVQYTCVLLSGGFIKCWGANNHGQLGRGDTESQGNEPGEMGIAHSWMTAASSVGGGTAAENSVWATRKREAMSQARWATASRR